MTATETEQEMKILIEKMELVKEFYLDQKYNNNEHKYSTVHDLVSQNKNFLTELGFWLFEQQVHFVNPKHKESTFTINIQTEHNNADLNKITNIGFYGFNFDFTVKEDEFLKQISRMDTTKKNAAKNLYYFRQSMMEIVQKMYGKIDVNFIFNGMYRQFKLSGTATYPQEVPDFKTHSGNINMDMYYFI